MEPQEPTLEESIQQVMQTLPPVIRDYLSKGEYSIVAKNLMAKYGLHIDQSGILEREIMLLLMGIENPAEFIQALVGEAKIDRQVVNKIVQDVNAQIFIPLKEEEMRSNNVTPKPLPTKPSADEKFLEDHEEPHIEIPKRTMPEPPANLPGALRPAEAFGVGGIIPLPQPLRPPMSQKPISPPISRPSPKATEGTASKPYSTDPYREPLE
jgi:hypothetical protein